MCTFEKAMLNEKKIMICAKVKVLRLTGPAEGGRTVRDYRDWLFSRAAFSCTLSQES